jgi:uncharacterized protein
VSTVFLDTVGLIALWDATDQWQPAANRALALLRVPGTRTVTTSFVLLECGNASARKPYRQDVDDLRISLHRRGDLIIPAPEEVEQAWIAYRNGINASAGIVDQVSFLVMRRLGITDVFSNDQHFKAAGFNTLC